MPPESYRSLPLDCNDFIEPPNLHTPMTLHRHDCSVPPNTKPPYLHTGTSLRLKALLYSSMLEKLHIHTFTHEQTASRARDIHTSVTAYVDVPLELQN